MSEPRAKGGCLCGGVRCDSVHGELTGVTACHCSQCARTTGNFYASANCAASAFALDVDETLRWYRSSQAAERGFCSRCGSTLFWRRIGGGTMSMTAGTLDRPTGLRLARHIYCASRSDYYDIIDDLPHHEAGT